MPVKYIKPSNLITPKYKYLDTVCEIGKGELSLSYGIPCTFSYCPDLRKYLLMDGNHRAIQQINNGITLIHCEINIYVPKYYPKGDYITIDNKKQFTL